MNFGTDYQHSARRDLKSGGRSPTWSYTGRDPGLAEKFLAVAENVLRSKPKDEEALREEREKRLKEKIGNLALELDTTNEAIRGLPFVPNA